MHFGGRRKYRAKRGLRPDAHVLLVDPTPSQARTGEPYAVDCGERGDVLGGIAPHEQQVGALPDGDSAEAGATFRVQERGRRIRCGAKSLDAATDLAALAQVYCQQERPEEAKRLVTRARSIVEVELVHPPFELVERRLGIFYRSTQVLFFLHAVSAKHMPQQPTNPSGHGEVFCVLSCWIQHAK